MLIISYCSSIGTVKADALNISSNVGITFVDKGNSDNSGGKQTDDGSLPKTGETIKRSFFLLGILFVFMAIITQLSRRNSKKLTDLYKEERNERDT